jgi:hypothetical protein
VQSHIAVTAQGGGLKDAPLNGGAFKPLQGGNVFAVFGCSDEASLGKILILHSLYLSFLLFCLFDAIYAAPPKLITKNFWDGARGNDMKKREKTSFWELLII